MRFIEDEKQFDEEQEDIENEAARFLRNLRDHGFASSNEQFGFALGQSHRKEASHNAIKAIEKE
ncbi:MAG TPA: hypothetical protein VN843_18240 [Anaerolineales bacterium]|nr:hypothetical protein [Anaerolineales bacterium]